MHTIRPPAAACCRGGTDSTARNPPKRADGSDADRDSPTKPAHAVTQIPGIRERAPRRNALVVFLYLLGAMALASLFGQLAGVIPFSTGCVISTTP